MATIFLETLSSLISKNNNFHLLASSPALNKGNNSESLGSIDLEGNARIQNDIVDLGAYETETSGPLRIISYYPLAGQNNIARNVTITFLVQDDIHSIVTRISFTDLQQYSSTIGDIWDSHSIFFILYSCSARL